MSVDARPRARELTPRREELWQGQRLGAWGRESELMGNICTTDVSVLKARNCTGPLLCVNFSGRCCEMLLLLLAVVVESAMALLSFSLLGDFIRKIHIHCTSIEKSAPALKKIIFLVSVVFTHHHYHHE